ncbi:MAG: YbbR-like domain-containing protein [Candidatus Solibacter usitatus]|nr:YbbR-like domain-containing protein [Candidatus Solibacter usitatus]
MTGWFTQNLGWKLGSLVIATLLWISVSNEPELSTFQSVPVEYKQMPEDMEIGSSVDETVRLELRGPSGRLRDLRDAKLAVVLDFSGVSKAGDRTFAIDERNVSLPRGIRLVRAIPGRLQFHLVSKTK